MEQFLTLPSAVLHSVLYCALQSASKQLRQQSEKRASFEPTGAVAFGILKKQVRGYDNCSPYLP